MIHNVAMRGIYHLISQGAKEFVQLSQSLNIPSYVSPLTPPSPMVSRRRERTLMKKGGLKLLESGKLVLASDAKFEEYLYVSLRLPRHVHTEVDLLVWRRGSMSSM